MRVNAFRVCSTIILCAVAVAARSAKSADLDLQSADGPWQFHRAQKLNPSLPRVLLIGDSITAGYEVMAAQVVSHVLQALTAASPRSGLPESHSLNGGGMSTYLLNDTVPRQIVAESRSVI